MSPANIESKVKAAGPLIGQAVTIGDARPLQQRADHARPRCDPGARRAGGRFDAIADELAGNEKVIAAVQEEIDAANEQLARVEQIKKFVILPTEWEPGGEELTPTMKLKRKPIAEKYKDEIEGLYS